MERERCLASREVYSGRILNLRVDEIELPGGHRALREVVEHDTAVAVLALTGKDKVLLVRQYRYAVGAETLEVCAGLVEKGEEPSAAAVREMREELGCKPGSLKEIGRFYASPGFCTELLVLFLAEDLTASSLPQDDDEDVRPVEIHCGEIPGMLAEGLFQDAKTFAALSWLMAFRGIKPEFAKG